MGNAHHTCAGVIGGDFPQSLCQALITFHEKRNKCAHHASKSLFLLRDLDPPPYRYSPWSSSWVSIMIKVALQK